MSAKQPAFKGCLDCKHWVGASMQNRAGCGLRKPMKFVWPEKLGDEHGFTAKDGRARCWEERPQGQRFERNRRQRRPVGMVAAGSGYGKSAFVRQIAKMGVVA